MNASKSLESAIEYATNAGFEYAQQCLTEEPTVREFKPSDEMPEGDYVDFKRRFDGLFLDEMEETYRKAFNAKIAEEKISVDDDLCERWLGRDWPESMTPAEAMATATKCQAKQDAGDERDYAVILAEVTA